MRIEIKINNMMCENCQKHIREALEMQKGVEKVTVSLEEKMAFIEGENLEISSLKKAIEELDYEIESIVQR